jgi:hypothetical protein
MPPVVPTPTPVVAFTPVTPSAVRACVLAAAPTSFMPYPPGADHPDTYATSGFFPYAGSRLLAGEAFGYQILDITNRTSPQSLGFEDYRISPTYPGPIPCGGDCHGTIGAVSVSADGQRVIFGTSSLAAGSSPWQARVGQASANGWGFTLAGDMAPAVPWGVLVQRVGSSYYAYTFASDGVRVADATTLPGLDPSVSNSLNPALATYLPGGYTVTLTGYWITYTDGPNVYLVNASSPLPASALVAQRFTNASFGHTGSLASYSVAQSSPASVYLLGEFTGAGWTLVQVQGGIPTVIGSLVPATGETLTGINGLATDSTGNVFAFMWVRTSVGVYRCYTSSVIAFGSAPGFFDVTTTGFAPGHTFVAGTTAGQIYEYTPSGLTGWIVPMSCVQP